MVTTRVRRDGSRRAVVARVRREHRSSTAVAHNREIVRDILGARGVPFHDAGTDLVVSPSDESRVTEAIRAAAPLLHCEPAPAGMPDEGVTATGRRDLLVFEHTVARGGTSLYESEVACRVRLSDDPQIDEESVDFPIDIVYTWVDGNDPDWQARRAAALGHASLDGLHPEAASRARFESIDELRFSLRSVERFAEFVRHVYIVTDAQCPGWLDTSHAGVTVVDHRTIFPDETYLPVFNSHAIEARLHHIPGLADHYLYLNDDFLFTRRVTPRDFFDPDGTVLVFQSQAQSPAGPVTPDTKPVDAAAINVRNLVQREFGVEVPREKFKHAPYAQRKRVYELIEDRFGPELDRTARSRVRSMTDVAVASSLHQHVALVTGMGRPSQIDAGYVDLGQAHLRTRLERLRRTPMPKVICMNDSDQDGTPHRVKVPLVRQFFEDVFPDKSAYER